ncbi:MAG: hypothetical protein JO128_11365 [Alphaproteobacteria bacterium]|nr:hypothetical protein [Alphaproteobacteria bacterium]
MLRRAHIAGLLLAAIALPALAADFIVNGNVNVAGQQGAPGNLTVSGTVNFPTQPGPDTPICNLSTLGQVGVGFWQKAGNERDVMLYYCGLKLVVQNGHEVQYPQRYFLNASMNAQGNIYPSWWPDNSASGQAARGQSGADTAALAARVATLEKQLAALKAVTCRDHASEAACR